MLYEANDCKSQNVLAVLHRGKSCFHIWPHMSGFSRSFLRIELGGVEGGAIVSSESEMS